MPGGVALYMLVMLALAMARSTGGANAPIGQRLAVQPGRGADDHHPAHRCQRAHPCRRALPPATDAAAYRRIDTDTAGSASGRADAAPLAGVSLVESLGAYPTLALFAFGPWLLLGWPIVRLGRWLADAYRAKRFSDLTYLVGIYWFLILFASAPAEHGKRWLAGVYPASRPGSGCPC